MASSALIGGSDHPAIRARVKRIARPWRIAFIVYAIALTVGTHWPRLNLSVAGYLATDKMVHLYAFAGLTILLRLTRWVRRTALLFLIIVAWTLLDEWTQAEWAVERTMSWMDMVAGIAGAAVACLWIAAVRPVGGGANRSRIAIQRFTFEELFGGFANRRRRLAWMLAALATIPTGLGLIFIWPIVVGRLPEIEWAIGYGLGQTAILGGLILIFQRIWSREWKEALQSQRCPECGKSCSLEVADESGAITCPRCGTALCAGMWLEAPAPPGPRLRKMLVAPLAIGFAMYVIAALVFYGAVFLYGRFIETEGVGTLAVRSVRAVNDLPTDFVMTMDFAILLGSLAVLVMLYRRRLARWHDRQDERCRVCDYDLTGTMVEGGLGRCPECGSPFARFL